MRNEVSWCAQPSCSSCKYFVVCLFHLDTQIFICVSEQEMTQIILQRLRSVFPLTFICLSGDWLPVCLPVYMVSCAFTLFSCIFYTSPTLIPWQMSLVGCRTLLYLRFLYLHVFIFHFTMLQCLQNFPLYTVRRAESATPTSPPSPSSSPQSILT